MHDRHRPEPTDPRSRRPRRPRRTGRAALALLAGAALAAALGGCSEGRAARRPNVLLVCIDTLRADHLGCYGHATHPTSPALDALAERSTLFLDASATAGWTKPSVPSFLTGTLPMQHGVYDGSSSDEDGVHSDVLPERAVTLAERFQHAGYRTGAFVKNAHLRRGLGFEQGFETYVDQAGDAREIRWRARDWLEEGEGERPFFLYLHLLDVHWPYPVPDEYASRFANPEAVELFRTDDWKELRDDVNDGRVQLDERDREALLALYDGAIRYVDDELGRLLAWLAAEGLDEDTVVCVISDHGEEFLEHGKIGHGHGLWQGLLHVPWILHVPGRAPRRVAAPVSLLDLYPTLLAAAGLAPPGGLDGLDRLAAPERPAPILAEHLEPGSYTQALRAERAKLLRTFEPREPAAPERVDRAAALALGERWEVFVVPAEEGAGAAALVAERLRPRPDPDADPLEVKGTIAGLSPEGFRVCGLAVRLEPGFELYGDGERTLRDGLFVKVRGALDEEGTVVARKVKSYPEDEEREWTLRGEITSLALDGEGGSLAVAGVGVRLDAASRVETERAERPRMDRVRVAELLALDVEGAHGAAAAELGLDLAEELFDLATDPGERRPAGPSPELERLARQLEALVRERAAERIWAETDRAGLSEEDLRALRALGYVR